MEERKTMIESHALIVKEEGALGLASCEELKEVIFQHFNIRKHEIYVYHSYPHSFIIVFAERHARDVVFAAGRAINGPVELQFMSWELDEFGEGGLCLTISDSASKESHNMRGPRR
jgi:hypothetical protein